MQRGIINNLKRFLDIVVGLADQKRQIIIGIPRQNPGDAPIEIAASESHRQKNKKKDYNHNFIPYRNAGDNSINWAKAETSHDLFIGHAICSLIDDTIVKLLYNLFSVANSRTERNAAISGHVVKKTTKS